MAIASIGNTGCINYCLNAFEYKPTIIFIKNKREKGLLMIVATKKCA